MPPESAIGALLRCDQAVVVGDTNQLPPSSFFKTMIDDEDADDDEAVLNESVLEMANGAFRPARRLRWHYRSRQSGLIKFSNRLVYDDNLIVFPSATESVSRMGVSLVRFGKCSSPDRSFCDVSCFAAFVLVAMRPCSIGVAPDQQIWLQSHD
jgi:superfamily I DNA and/or RNA helicase